MLTQKDNAGNWIKLIMKSMEDIDDYIDTKSLDEYDILSNSIISVVSNPDCPTDLPENISEYCSRIHIMLAVLGDSRLDFFIRSLRLLFDISKKTRNSQDLEEYFRYEIIEGRLS